MTSSTKARIRQPRKQAASRDRETSLAKKLLSRMILIRTYEQHVERLFYRGEVAGFHHAAIGAEGVSVGSATVLKRTDSLVSTHRGHGDAIAKGAPLEPLLAEMHGLARGCCKGRGGSMHITAPDVGFVGVSAIVGGTIPIATGLAFAAKYRRSARVAMAVFGDGAANTGIFHESLNMAALWRLPVIFVCNNNGYAESTPQPQHQSVRRVSMRARAYAMPGVTVNGRDVFAVYDAAEKAVVRARSGGGPTLIECVAPRWVGHYVGDPGKAYMQEGARRRAQRQDPMVISARIAQDRGWLTEADVERMTRRAERQVLAARGAAESSRKVDVRSARRGIAAMDLDIVG